MAKYKTLIGRYEMVAFPEHLLEDVPAKVDTGAYLSSIHTTDIREVTVNGKKVLKFKLLATHQSYDYSREISTTDYQIKTIENSFGQSEKRFAVELKVKVANKVFFTEFTLANREKKAFPILLGRKLLNARFLVDSDLNNLNKKVIKKNIISNLDESAEG